MSAFQDIGAAIRIPAKRRESLIQRVRGLLHDWGRRARYRAELARFDDRTLLDVAFDKATVELEAARPFWARPLSAWADLARSRRRQF